MVMVIMYIIQVTTYRSTDDINIFSPTKVSAVETKTIHKIETLLI